MRFFKLTDEFSTAFGHIVIRENEDGHVDLLNIEGEWVTSWATPTMSDVRETYNGPECSVTEITEAEAVYA